MEIESWVSMPKVELHAHLNGSARNSTLLELARDLGQKGIIVFSDVEHVILKNDRSLNEVFKLFDLIHVLTTDHAIVTRITKEVVEDFAAENVVYLELRTTPKRNDSKGMTKHSYMEAVIEGLRKVDVVDINFSSTDLGIGRKVKSSLTSDINALARKKIYARLLLGIDRRETLEAAMETDLGIGRKVKSSLTSDITALAKKKIYVRLLLSIDRRETLEAAMETVKLAIELKHVGVVGIDLSGNPRVGEWITFLPALKFAREQGLRVTLHCGEVPNQEEIHGMLDFLPERIGHACCLEEDAWRKLQLSKIPVEICLTSNIRTDTISSFDVHHFADLYNRKHPLILCTDDMGVFSTSLSKEYAIASATFGLGKKELFRLAKNAVEFSFAEENVLKELREFFESKQEEYAL